MACQNALAAPVGEITAIDNVVNHSQLQDTIQFVSPCLLYWETRRSICRMDLSTGETAEMEHFAGDIAFFKAYPDHLIHGLEDSGRFTVARLTFVSFSPAPFHRDFNSSDGRQIKSTARIVGGRELNDFALSEVRRHPEDSTRQIRYLFAVGETSFVLVYMMEECPETSLSPVTPPRIDLVLRYRIGVTDTSNSVSLSRDERFLAVGSEEGKVFLFRIDFRSPRTGKLRLRFARTFCLRYRSRKRRARGVYGGPSFPPAPPVNYVHFSPDSTKLVYTNSKNVVVCDAERQKFLLAFRLDGSLSKRRRDQTEVRNVSQVLGCSIAKFSPSRSDVFCWVSYRRPCMTHPDDGKELTTSLHFVKLLPRGNFRHHTVAKFDPDSEFSLSQGFSFDSTGRMLFLSLRKDSTLGFGVDEDVAMQAFLEGRLPDDEAKIVSYRLHRKLASRSPSDMSSASPCRKTDRTLESIFEDGVAWEDESCKTEWDSRRRMLNFARLADDARELSLGVSLKKSLVDIEIICV